jgi:flagellar basal body-associated protein FliL
MADNSTSRNIIIGVIVVVLILVILFATGLLGAESEGDFETPEVSVQGGELPQTDLEAADIDVGTTTTTTEVPTLEVDTENVTTETPTVDVDPVE